MPKAKIYWITETGLKPLQRSDIKPVVGMALYYGASSSPSRIIITGVDKDYVTFRKYPYKTDQREQRSCFLDLADRGTKMQIKMLSDYMMSSYAVESVRDIFADRIANLEAALNGGVGKLENIEDNQPILLLIQPTGEFDDAWHELESYEEWSGQVSYQENETRILAVSSVKGDIKGIEERLPEGFKYVGFKED